MVAKVALRKTKKEAAAEDVTAAAAVGDTTTDHKSGSGQRQSRWGWPGNAVGTADASAAVERKVGTEL